MTLLDLGCKDLIDLALLMPKKYENLELASTPRLNAYNCVKVTIKSKKFLQARLLTCLAYSHNFDCDCVISIFNPKPFHNHEFALNKELFIYAKAQNYNGLVQFCNPKILKDAGKITPLYGIRGQKNSEISEFKRQNLNYDVLKNEYFLDDCKINLLLKMCDDDAKCIELLESDELKNCLKFVEIFHHIIKLNKLYAKIPKHEVIEANELSEWFSTLPFRPTQDQLNAISDIRADLGKKRHKKRIIMGDVGCGKSLVMFAAALSVYPKKCVLMAPTSVLANQLFLEAKRLLPEYIKIALFDKKEYEIAKNSHFIIGTHALLFSDIANESALIMIDEQQRFGTKQRERLHELATNAKIAPHYIEFSATPIPRTTALLNSSIINYSFIKELPFPKDIQTILLPSSESAALFAHMKEEIAKNHQCIVVYPLIKESSSSIYKPLENVIDFYQKTFKNVYVTHGKDKQKDEILQDFAKDGDVLLSTSIVEVGISLPRLSIIVIVAPERYGLASLHQLRGRVGRNGVKSYCYLLSKNKFSQRLIDFSQTLDGFKIAQIDLENRKSGDIIDGDYQHGDTFKYYEALKDREILEEANAKIRSLNDKNYQNKGDN